MTTPVRVFVDYVCPFCLLIEGAIEELKQDRNVRVEVQPFELRPAPTSTLRPEDPYLPRIWKSSVYPMARRVGMPIVLPQVSPQPRTRDAFLVLQLANEVGVAEAYSRAMFAAFFYEERDIGQRDVILDVATSVGLDLEASTAALDSEERHVTHAESLRWAVEEVGVTSVPSFLIRDRLLSGVVGASELKTAVDLATSDEVSL